MRTTRYFIKRFLFAVTAICVVSVILAAIFNRLFRSDWVLIPTKKDCPTHLRNLIDELAQHDVQFQDCEVYRRGLDFYLSCHSDEQVLTSLKSHLHLKVLSPTDWQIKQLYNSADESPLAFPKSNSAEFYEGPVDYSPNETVYNDFFVVAYDQSDGRLLVWIYSLV